MAQNLIINATDTSGNKVQAAVTNVNPSATDYQLKVFAQGLNSLTTNTFNSAQRVDRDDISDAEGADPEFSVTPATDDVTNNSRYDRFIIADFQLSYLGDARTVTLSGKKPEGTTVTFDGKTMKIQAKDSYRPSGEEDEQTTAVMTLTLAGDDTYKAAQATVTFSGYASNFEDIN